MSDERPPTIIRSTTMPLAELHHYYKNARRHAEGEILTSLKTHGQYRSIVVNIGTITGRPYEVLGGNGTLAGMRELDFPTANVDLVDVDNDQARKIVLVDNRTNDLAYVLGYDLDVLIEELGELPDLDGSGWSQDAVDRLLTPPEVTDEDESLGDGGRQFQVIVECRDETDQTNLLSALEAEGRNARALNT